MNPEDLEKLLKLIALGQQAFMEAMTLINNHKLQSGKTEAQILDEAEQKVVEAQEIIKGL